MAQEKSMKPTYSERAQIMSAEARQEFVQQLTEKFSAFKEAVSSGKLAIIEAANIARDMGDDIKSVTGHEKLLTNEFHQMSLVLPEATISFAKECLAVRRAFEQPFDTYATAKPVFEKLVAQLELLPKSKREAAKIAGGAINPVEHFLHEVGVLASRYAKLEKESPVESWPDFYKQTFLNESARIVSIRERILNVG